jgi:signal transduction histidine kinase
MHSRGSITARHVAFAVLVVIIVNAQLTWWIVFTTGQARDRLELERSLLDERARSWAGEAAVSGRDNEPPIPAGLEVIPVDAIGSSIPFVELGGERRGWAIRPAEETWESILSDYRRRIVMMVSEGGFFALLLMVMIGLLWRSFRREVELERRHRNFLSAITHELQSPIAAIRVSLETVAKGRADEATSRRFLANALADTDRLGGLVKKVLQVTRYDDGSSKLRPHRVSLSRLVEGAVEAFDSRAQAVGARVDVEILPGLWAVVDDEAMTIGVSNLLENALKYGGDPAEIRVELTAQDGRGVLLVTDNGSGIPDGAVPFIFDRFYRAGDELTRTSQGTGLGLYLVQRIVKAHHGSISVAETGAGGTTFRMTLPGVEVGEDRE